MLKWMRIAINEDEDEEEEDVFAESVCIPENMLLMLETLLAFHAWYKRGHPFFTQNKSRKKVLMSIRIMMRAIKTNAPRVDRNGWKLQKFHDMLHIVRDIENFGSPNNVDSAPNENNLIDFAKEPGRRAHKKREVFVSQISKCLR